MSDELFPAGTLMQGKRGLVMGVANDRSIAWGIARQLAAQGAALAFTYQGEALGKRMRPLAESVGSDIVLECDVTQDDQLDAVFAALAARWGKLDFLVHSIAFSDKNELRGSFVENTTRENFLRTMDISVYSWVATARRAAAIMERGGSMLTLSYLGSERVLPSYNVMGVAKAGLEAATRYIARDLGPAGIRVNAISAGAMKTLALAGIQGGRDLLGTGRAWSLLKEDTSMEGVAGAALWLLSDLGRSTTAEVIHVDAGFHAVGVPETQADGEGA
jgi:enoyl-[acyl-carrier protein] reductase I